MLRPLVLLLRIGVRRAATVIIIYVFDSFKVIVVISYRIPIAVGHLCQQSVVGGIRVAGQAAGTNLNRGQLSEAVIGHVIGLSQSVHRARHR